MRALFPCRLDTGGVRYLNLDHLLEVVPVRIVDGVPHAVTLRFPAPVGDVTIRPRTRVALYLTRGGHIALASSAEALVPDDASQETDAP